VLRLARYLIGDERASRKEVTKGYDGKGAEELLLVRAIPCTQASCDCNTGQSQLVLAVTN
jgi:hypothetical protein